MATELNQQTEDDVLSAKELILTIQSWMVYLLSRWRVLLLAGILGGIIGLGYAFWKQPQYTAITTFVLESGESKSGLSQYAGVAAMVGIDLGVGTSGLFQGDNILELYRSRTMLAQALLSKTYPDADELLIERYIKYNEFEGKWSKVPELNSINFREDPASLSPKGLRVRDSVVTKFVETINEEVLTVDKPDKKLSIVKVEVTSPDEVFSKAFNETLVREVNEFYIQTKTKKSTENIAILEAKVDSVRAVMTGAIYSAAHASDKTPNLNPTRQVQRIAPVQKAQFSAEANQAILGQLLQNLELAKMNMLQEQPLIQFVDRPVYPLKVSFVGKVKGVTIGALLFGFIVSIILIIFNLYRAAMSDGSKL